MRRLRARATYWAAYFSVETDGDLIAGKQPVAETAELLRSFGLRPRVRDPRCDGGALAALKLDEGAVHRVVGTYFALRQQARRIGRSVDYLPAVAVARVTIRCV